MCPGCAGLLANAVTVFLMPSHESPFANALPPLVIWPVFCLKVKVLPRDTAISRAA
ncbi:hypothetical protein DAQ1742_04392 [Dickeya aquatica]|uniref:Uncharacterized protein n=1 Tax=Dickeya aquatica TaxID=1401087 RepID=A0A375AGK3_9GAMM|nr:hypothetical protein DAQ1742_04392 [Dickeya aquatica]